MAFVAVLVAHSRLNQLLPLIRALEQVQPRDVTRLTVVAGETECPFAELLPFDMEKTATDLVPLLFSRTEFEPPPLLFEHPSPKSKMLYGTAQVIGTC